MDVGLTPHGLGVMRSRGQVVLDADPCLCPSLDGPGGVPAGFGAEAARGAQGGGEGVSKPEGELDPGLSLSPVKRWVTPGCTPGCWEPLPGQNPALLLPGCPSSGHVPSAGLSQRAVPVQGERLWHAGAVLWPQQLLGVTRSCGARTVWARGVCVPAWRGLIEFTGGTRGHCWMVWRLRYPPKGGYENGGLEGSYEERLR